MWVLTHNAHTQLNPQHRSLQISGTSIALPGEL
jgi:hypothetical protein